jgi:hypothetical protein
MQLPFTREAFFDLFAAYNNAMWPAVVAIWLVSAFAAWMLWFRHPQGRWVSALLAIQWAWSGIAYHVVYFTRINPAAWLFAAMFVAQAGLFVWSGVIQNNLSFTSGHTRWAQFGRVLMLYALAYPLINMVEHGSVTRIPTFALPCPTTILTAGVLLQTASPLRSLAIIPILWAAIGGSAAMLLGVSADYALAVAGVALAGSSIVTEVPPRSGQAIRM